MGAPLAGVLTRRRLALGPALAGPAGDRTNGVRTLNRLATAASGGDGLVPSGRHQPGRQVGERGEYEEPRGGLPVGHNEQPICLAGVQRKPLGRAGQRKPGAAEDQQVKVDLARPPALAILSPECSLETLERHEQRNPAGCRIRPRGHIQGHDGVPEVRLIHGANRLRCVEPRDAPEPHTGQRREHADACGEGRGSIAEVRPEAHIRPDSVHEARRLPRYTRAVTRVVVIILHAVPRAGAGPLESAFAMARGENARRQVDGFAAVGADARVVEVHAGDAPFGARLRELRAAHAEAGLIVLGSGSVPFATSADRRAFVAAAAGNVGRAVLSNNRYSADILAIPPGIDLHDFPDLAADNAAPRWFAERGANVRDLPDRWRLQVDLDSPVDVILSGLGQPLLADGLPDPTWQRVRDAAERIRTTTGNPEAELLIAGRTSAGIIRWVERHTASRTRALIEERGMRTARPAQRPARSTLGLLLDQQGPEALGRILGQLSDAAVVDTRVLLAHRLGTSEAAWPAVEDRFASDLLLHERVQDPWLRALTRAATEASVPILLGGHTLVGPGLRLLLQAGRR